MFSTDSVCSIVQVVNATAIDIADNQVVEHWERDMC